MRDPYTDVRPMTRRRRRRALALLIVPLVLLGLLALADRVAARTAEDKIADRIVSQSGQQDIQTGDPDVEVEGYPFLTQALRGKYQGVQIHMRDVVARGLTVPRLDIRASDVRAETAAVLKNRAQVEAGKVTGEAVVTYQSIMDAIGREGLELSADNGRLRIKMPVPVDGVQVPVDALTRISINGDRVRLDIEKVTTAGIELPARVRSAFNSLLNNEVIAKFPIPALPYSLVIDTVRATDPGLAVTAHASNVLLAS